MLRKALSGKRAAALRKNPLRGGGGPAQLRRIGAQGVKTCAPWRRLIGLVVGIMSLAAKVAALRSFFDFSWVLLEPAEGA